MTLLNALIIACSVAEVFIILAAGFAGYIIATHHWNMVYRVTPSRMSQGGDKPQQPQPQIPNDKVRASQMQMGGGKNGH